MQHTATRVRATTANNRQAGFGVLGFMLMAALLLLGLPSPDVEEASSQLRPAVTAEAPVTDGAPS